MNSLISVIMPAYNSSKYVKEAIKSVLEQTYKNIELIIIDDASSDETVSIVRKMKLIDNRITLYVNKQNEGVSYSRNRGIKKASGEWVAFLDSDDFWHKEKLEIQLKYAEEKNLNFIFTGVSYIDEKGNGLKSTFQVPKKVSYGQLLKQNVIACSSVLIKKVYMEKYKMENDKTHEDFGSWLRILKEETYAYGINKPLLIYRISANSKSGNKIKSVLMTYKTYIYIGLNPFLSIYYLTWYIFNGIKKYENIKSVGK